MDTVERHYRSVSRSGHLTACGHDLAGTLLPFRPLTPIVSSAIQSPRSTTTKTRVRVGSHHETRIYKENRPSIFPKFEGAFRYAATKAMDSQHALVVSEHEKGVRSILVTRSFPGQAVAAGKPVTEDPKRPVLNRYCGATVITWDLSEARLTTAPERELATGQLDDFNQDNVPSSIWFVATSEPSCSLAIEVIG